MYGELHKLLTVYCTVLYSVHYGPVRQRMTGLQEWNHRALAAPLRRVPPTWEWSAPSWPTVSCAPPAECSPCFRRRGQPTASRFSGVGCGKSCPRPSLAPPPLSRSLGLSRKQVCQRTVKKLCTLNTALWDQTMTEAAGQFNTWLTSFSAKLLISI